jgi:hypothetical protein
MCLWKPSWSFSYSNPFTSDRPRLKVIFRWTFVNEYILTKKTYIRVWYNNIKARKVMLRFNQRRFHWLTMSHILTWQLIELCPLLRGCSVMHPLNLIKLLTIFPIYTYIHHIFRIWFVTFMHLKIRGMNHSKHFPLMYPAQYI